MNCWLIAPTRVAAKAASYSKKKEVVLLMERNDIAVVNSGNTSHVSLDNEKQNISGGMLGWWYRYFAPAEPPATASLAQREKARRGRMASIAVLFVILFVLTLVPQGLANKNFMQVIVALVGIGVCFFALFLNRRGFVELAGALTLIMWYSGQAFTLLTLPGGLTAGSLTLLDATVLPDILVLAFFSANSLFLIVCINIAMTGAIVVYGPHDATITSLLHHDPQQIFTNAFILQLLTAAALYLWARSTEQALKRADRAEEIAALEKREKGRQQRELEQKRKLDAGVQQILQTLVAAANGDLKVRAPLSQDHILWQTSVALNNLIARLQSSTLVERALQKQIAEESDRVTGHHIKVETGKVAHPEPDGTSQRAHKQQVPVREENERVASQQGKDEEGKVARPVPGDIVERSPRQQVPLKRKWVVVDTGEGKVVRPGQSDIARKRNEGAASPLPDPNKRSPS